MGIRFTNRQIKTKDRAVVLVVTHSETFTASEILAAAIVESAFGGTTIQRQKEGHQRFIDDPNVITINLVDLSDTERRNIGRKSEKERGGVNYTTASLTWYSFASILLANVGISGEHTNEIIEAVDADFFLPLDQYQQATRWYRWLFVKGGGYGKELDSRLRGSILGNDDICFRHAMEGAKIILHQIISRAVSQMQTKMEEDPRFVDEQEFRTTANRPVFLVARPVQCLGQKVFYAREDLEALEEGYESRSKKTKEKDVVPRSEIAKEVEKIIKERFRKIDLEESEDSSAEPRKPRIQSNIEKAITDYASDQFHEQTGIDPHSDSNALNRIQNAARRAEEMLSKDRVNTAKISLRNLIGPHHMEVTITPELWARFKSEVV